MDPLCLNSFSTPLTSHLSLQDLGDLRQLNNCSQNSLFEFDFGSSYAIGNALGVVKQEIMGWARQHEADGRYRDAEYLFRRASSSSNVSVKSENLYHENLYQSEDVLRTLVSIYEKMGDYPAAEMAQETLLKRLFAAEMAQETLLKRLFAANPEHITEEQTRAVYAYSILLLKFQKRVLDLSLDVTARLKTFIDFSIAYRVAALDITLLNEVSLEQGLIILEPNRGSCPSLHLAAKENAINLARLIIKKGADVNSRDPRSNTPLHIAVRYAKQSMIADIEAVDENKETIVSSLISAKADMEATDPFGLTALMIAIQRDLAAVTLLLLEQGVNVEALGKFGETPLSIAIEYRREWAVKLLLEKGASLARTNGQGYTALHIAIITAQESNVQILLDHGRMTKSADIYAKDWDGYTALHQAVWMGHTSQETIVRQLLSHSAPLDAKDHDGDTVFHLAVIFRRRNIIAMLLQYVEPGKLPSTCHVRNNRGETVLGLARKLAENTVGSSDERSVLYLLGNALELSHSFIHNTS